MAESFDHEVKSISHEMYEEFLDETFLPYVRKVILQSTNAVKANSRGLDQFMACLAQCLRCESVPIKVCVVFEKKRNFTTNGQQFNAPIALKR